MGYALVMHNAGTCFRVVPNERTQNKSRVNPDKMSRFLRSRFKNLNYCHVFLNEKNMFVSGILTSFFFFTASVKAIQSPDTPDKDKTDTPDKNTTDTTPDKNYNDWFAKISRFVCH